MKLATLERGAHHAHVAVVMGDNDLLDLVALRGVMPEAEHVPADMRHLLAGGAASLDAVRKCLDGVDSLSARERDGLREQDILQRWDSAVFLPPVPNPEIILSVGMNYHRHLEEMDNVPAPAHPTAFLMVRTALTGAGQPIIVPPQCPDMIDFEGEFCFVFGRSCHNVVAGEAMDYVAGYTIANDVSARDWTAPVFTAKESFEAIDAWNRNLLGKQLPSFCPCGPVIVTKDEIADPHDLQLTLSLNGEVMQSSNTDDLIFGLPEIISYFSRWYEFSPGDIVTTGSPPGVGFGRDPKVFMTPGDTVEVDIEGIGKLSNPVVAG